MVYRQLQRKEITLDWSCGQCRSVETRNDDDDVQPPSPPTSPPCETLELPPRPHIPDLMQDDEPTRIPDTSFNVSGDIGSLPMIQDEELEDRPPSPVDAPDGPVPYEGGTRIGARMLLGSDGFTYNVKRENKSTGFIYWVCSVRSKANRCPAWVKEYGASRVSGYIPHNHPADPTKAGKLRTSVLKIGLQIKAVLENITNLKAEGEDFRWFIRLKCLNCGEETTKFEYLTLEENAPLKGGRGHASMVIKCKLCGRENSIDICRDTITPYNAEDSNKFKTIVVFDCRGVEPVDFSARVGFTAEGEETGTKFPEVDLNEGEWVDYDEKKKDSVGITELKHQFVTVK